MKTGTDLEFPPRIVGELPAMCGVVELVKLGHEVHLITVEFGEAPLYEVVEVRVHRVPVALSDDFSTGW